MEYEDYEKLIYEKRKENGIYLDIFEKELKKAGLAKNTINRHISNIAFYINDYLLYYSIVDMKNGMSHIAEFLSYWFIEKASWATKNSIISNIGSLNKFYKIMVEKGFADKKDYEDMLMIIKTEKDSWIYECEHYYDDYDYDDDYDEDNNHEGVLNILL